jgi:hypothetical protein
MTAGTRWFPDEYRIRTRRRAGNGNRALSGVRETCCRRRVLRTLRRALVPAAWRLRRVVADRAIRRGTG